MTAEVLIHATAILLAAAATPFGGAADGAVLLLGESGAGKSDVALRLIASGARLISDDQTRLFDRDGRLFAAAPESLAGRLEIRGAGIISLPQAGPQPVVLAVRLARGVAAPRLPEPARLPFPALGLSGPPLIVLDPFEPSTPAKIAATAAALVRGAFVAGVGEPLG